MLPLLVSLPPKLRRLNANGEDIGAAYQRLCAKSWIEAGFTPVSVNSRREIEASPEIVDLASALGVEVVPVDRDAHAIAGRANVFLTDVLAVGIKVSAAGPFAITNADIFLDGAVIAGVAGLGPREFFMRRRIEIVSPENRDGQGYSGGFDFFALHSAAAAAIPDIGLLIGAPWWDHYLPILLTDHGCKRAGDIEGGVYHLEHEDRWNKEVWRNMGADLSAKIMRLLSSPEMDGYLRRIGQANVHDTGSIIRNFVYDVRQRLLPSYRRREVDRRLRRVSGVNISLISHF